MARVAIAGRVKTRLARATGAVEALRFYRTTSAAILARLSRQPFWETIIIVTPDPDAGSRTLPRRIRRMGQGGGDLGARMQAPMQGLPPGPVCVIGTDIPGVRAAHVRLAFRKLGGCAAVFGPAEDGGFWLVGQRRRPRLLEPYAGVVWSRPDTLAATLANLAGQRIGFTARISDVDGPDDLARQHHLLGRRVLPAIRGASRPGLAGGVEGG